MDRTLTRTPAPRWHGDGLERLDRRPGGSGRVLLGGPDDPDDPARHPARVRALRILGAALSSELLLPSWRARALRALGARLGPGAIIESGLRITLPSRLVAGSGLYVNFDCLLDTLGWIELGEQVSLGPGVRMMTTTHDTGGRARRAGERRYRPVHVGDGCWIGGGAIVLPGATIGAGCVVGGGAVVAGQLEPDGLYLGAPARRVRDLD